MEYIIENRFKSRKIKSLLLYCVNTLLLMCAVYQAFNNITFTQAKYKTMYFQMMFRTQLKNHWKNLMAQNMYNMFSTALH